MRHQGILTLLLVLSLNGTALAAEKLFHNGKIYTENPKHPWAEALLVRGERLAFVGSNRAAMAMAGPDAQRHDLGGKLVLPGLIDSHTHPGYIAKFNGLLDLPEADSREAQMASRRPARIAYGH